MEFDTSSKTILSIWAANPHASAAFKFSHNKKFLARTKEEPRRRKKRVQRDTTPQYDAPAQEEIRLCTDAYPRDLTKGWCFGSDSARCDVLLDRENSRGVSGLHFEINHNWTSFTVLIKNRSRNVLTMWLPNQDPDQIQEGETRALLKEPCMISLSVGLLRLILEVPARQDPAVYDQNLRRYYEKAITAIPLLGELDVQQRSNPTPTLKHHRYLEEKQLGKGLHARVFSAIDGSTGNIVAIKIFHDNIPNKTIEAEMNIVHVIDYIRTKRTLVMEFAAYGSLADSDHISHPQTYRLAKQMASALSYLHAQNITHRDVKPANILIVSKNPCFDFKLADFSISSESTNLTTFCGTPMYHAPEVEGGHYSNAIDIFSLGVVLVERWSDWYPNYVYNLGISRDTFLQDTLGAPSFVIDRHRKEIREKIEWTSTLKKTWIDWIRSQLQNETDKMMSNLFLNMLKMEPLERYSADFCHQYLQLPDLRYLDESPSTISEDHIEELDSLPSKHRDVPTRRPSKRSRRHNTGLSDPVNFSETRPRIESPQRPETRDLNLDCRDMASDDKDDDNKSRQGNNEIPRKDDKVRDEFLETLPLLRSRSRRGSIAELGSVPEVVETEGRK